MTYVIGVDPGKATGIAVYDLSTCKPVHMEETGNGIKDFVRVYQGLESDDDYCNSYTACEGFTLRSSNEFTANLQGVEIIGWLKGEALCATFPEPVQHMTITKLRKNKDKYQDSVITKMMQEAGFPIGAGHTRMALSVAVWYAAMKLKHKPTLEILSGIR